MVCASFSSYVGPALLPTRTPRAHVAMIANEKSSIAGADPLLLPSLCSVSWPLSRRFSSCSDHDPDCAWSSFQEPWRGGGGGWTGTCIHTSEATLCNNSTFLPHDSLVNHANHQSPRNPEGNNLALREAQLNPAPGRLRQRHGNIERSLARIRGSVAPRHGAALHLEGQKGQ